MSTSARAGRSETISSHASRPFGPRRRPDPCDALQQRAEARADEVVIVGDENIEWVHVSSVPRVFVGSKLSETCREFSSRQASFEDASYSRWKSASIADARVSDSLSAACSSSRHKAAIESAPTVRAGAQKTVGLGRDASASDSIERGSDRHETLRRCR